MNQDLPLQKGSVVPDRTTAACKSWFTWFTDCPHVLHSSPPTRPTLFTPTTFLDQGIGCSHKTVDICSQISHVHVHVNTTTA